MNADEFPQLIHFIFHSIYARKQIIENFHLIFNCYWLFFQLQLFNQIGTLENWNRLTRKNDTVQIIHRGLTHSTLMSNKKIYAFLGQIFIGPLILNIH